MPVTALILAPLLAANLASATPAFRCPVMDTSNLTEQNRIAAEAALMEACNIAASPEYQADVIRRSWHVGCKLTPFQSQTSISGEELAELMSSGLRDFRIELGVFSANSTVAETSVFHQRIRIRQERFTGWTSGSRQAKARLVNTLTHEMTHLFPREGSNNLYRFTDSGNWAPWCRARDLVSYGMGNLAEKHWLARNPV